jgi:hypothetical protein
MGVKGPDVTEWLFCSAPNRDPLKQKHEALFARSAAWAAWLGDGYG